MDCLARGRLHRGTPEPPAVLVHEFDAGRFQGAANRPVVGGRHKGLAFRLARRRQTNGTIAIRLIPKKSTYSIRLELIPHNGAPMRYPDLLFGIVVILSTMSLEIVPSPLR